MRGWLARILGNRGERHAAGFLKRKGYKILARQSASRFGEIDLIARDGETIVFVEVKTRTSDAAGMPFESITPHKQAHMTRAALAYLKRHRLLERRARFDVVAIVWPADAKEPVITHYVNAFEPTGFGQMYS